MSQSTPTASGSAGSQSQEESYRMILDFLSRRGHTKAHQALAAELEAASSPQISGGGKAVGLEDFADRNAPSQPKNGSQTPTSQPGQQRRRPDQAVAGGQLLADPTSWEKGYHGLSSFVENSLDIHRPELLPLLLPLFVHSYLDLVLMGFRDAADHFLERFSPEHQPSDPNIVRLLSSLRLPNHVAESEEATMWRKERYNVRISERGWGLVLGWLQGGGLVANEGTDSGGRNRVTAIINERVKVDAVAGPPVRNTSESGLASEYMAKRATALHDLKLGLVPLDPKLEKEVTRAVRDADGPPTLLSGEAPAEASVGAPPVPATDSQPTQEPASVATATSLPLTAEPESTLPPLVSPFPSELPPYPTSLRTIDVAREVEKVREARKRIRLGPEAYVTSSTALVKHGSKKGREKEKEIGAGTAAKPSVCLFTIHDAGESLASTSISEDSTLMACGFSESYIRLWSLQGGKLAGIKSTFDETEVSDDAASGLKKIRQKSAPTSRKLVGHSGPVYALSFDPVPGPSGPPRYLLSSSQDGSVRLWSLETYTNLVAYKGHKEPVWDVQWGPKGIYFATASRDRTARLWITDKISAVRIFVGHLSDVNCVRFHPNSLYIATGSADRTCRLWDVQKGSCVRVFVGHKGSVSAIAVSPDGRYLASASEDLTIILWDLASGRKIKSMTGHTSSIYSLSFSAESTVLVSGSADATVRVWDVLAQPVIESTAPAAKKFAAFSAATGGVDGAAAVAAARRASGAVLGLPKKDEKSKLLENDGKESADLLATLATKRTPVLNVQFTTRNLCLAVGPMSDST